MVALAHLYGGSPSMTLYLARSLLAQRRRDRDPADDGRSGDRVVDLRRILVFMATTYDSPTAGSVARLALAYDDDRARQDEADAAPFQA